MKKIMSLLVVVMLFAVALTGCGQQAGEPDTLIVAQGADARSLDPHATNDQPSSRVMKQIYNTLVVMDENMNIVPGLATDWQQIDELTWEFTLRQGVKFHNGEELKASDVKFTLDRMVASGQVAHIVSFIESVEAPEDYKVIINLKEPFAPILAHLAHTAASILNEKAVTEAGDDYGTKPVGTGPFKFVSWQSGDRITLEAFEDHFAGAPKVKRVVFRNITEGTNRTIALETGEVDIAYDIEPIDKRKVIDHPDLNLIEEPSLSMAYIGFNMNREPFNIKEVRQAINYAINRQDIIDAVLYGAGQIGTSPIAPQVFGFNPNIKESEYNVEKAKELLKQAGFENGFKTTIWTNDNPVRIQIATIVQSQLRDVGIDVTIETLEWGAYLDRTARGEHDMFILGWVTVTGDADYGLYALYHSTQKGGAGNRTFFENSRVDEILDQARVSIDFEERERLYHEAQEIIVEEAPAAILYYSTQNVGLNKQVQGFKLHPAGHHSLFGVSK
ncbi:glutathione ABC transporter substrate-binding protein [Anaerobranca gottschalkii]|uniref:Peptide/nickel transport system substrate-binding protein n=1 Tax=Anaerobranca gottschalkii DSM 13577 TaxID=1120990 RepID=A0A1H9YI85_9FIRM|nr:glutathione ABC transporter substrate-binding protein [Anaerobranca gottschalkii]SES68213.1 peptide/nickel transport system substrate-binding protein [Anaerobranca gottschalkii DSM 13577]